MKSPRYLEAGDRGARKKDVQPRAQRQGIRLLSSMTNADVDPLPQADVRRR